MGTVFTLPVVHPANLVEAIEDLKSNHHMRVVAAHPHAGQTLIHQASLSVDCCVVFGSEGVGISAAVLAACDEAVAIPMQEGIDSLNVGSASAVFLYEAQRQRSDLRLDGKRR
jgi:TrmH family RNA methyltransferase